MKKLTEKQIVNLKEFKNNGGTYVYLMIRKCFSSWYVRLFHVDNLLESGVIPSYWYRGLGDCTETQALKQGYKSLHIMSWWIIGFLVPIKN